MEEVTEKAEAIGEGIAIADKAMADFGKEMAEKNTKERFIGTSIIKLVEIQSDMAQAVKELDGLRQFLDNLVLEVMVLWVKWRN